MSKSMPIIAVSLVAMLLAAMQPARAGDASQQQDCFTNWSEAARVVSEQNLVSVATLSSQFRRQNLGEIIKTDLCRQGSNYVYRLVIRTAKGRFASATFDARRGIEIGVAGQNE